ncbi:hypothetical protein GOP47_0023714 [Adiantum capillus-veneris]|uniref:Vacuolar protein sorting-associated protein n=1 Tax=Adiantum capillus-veneris TaxID=13818 RepID=A0A9D4Z4Q5_ADICA|nr:hypothetical protein GOP47_0023714 [Adiantum capillus-veneris]
MFEAQVLQLLRQYLGEYVHGLSVEALRISVWQGDVVLKDLQLKAEALNSLKLPVIVKAGFLGSVTLKVPWNRLGKESVVVLLDRIFILAEPLQDERTSKEGEKEKLLEAKRHRLEEAESAMLDAKEKKSNQGENTAEASSWLGSLIATIIGNLKISITNVHIRYEDSTSNPGRPFCSGVTLSKLAAVTIDENSKETFVTSGALDKLHKSIQLERFSLYHDSNSSPWKFGKSWSDMTPKEWSEIFEAGINPKNPQDSQSAYLLCPINGVLNYYRRGKREKRERHMPLQSLSLVLDDVSLIVSENQYCDGLKLLEGVSRYRKRIEFSHFRPWVSVLEDPRTWWVYASHAGLNQQKKTWSHFSWKKVDRMCSLRRKYVQLYLEILQAKPKVENVQLKEIEEEVDTEVLLLWRLLARAKAESLKSKEASPQQDKTKGGWWGFRWRSAAADKAASLPEAGTPKQERELGDFTKEEWTKINELLNSRTGEEGSLLAAQEAPDSLQILVDATIKESAVRILDKEKVEILRGNFSALSLGLNLYPSTVDCSVKLQSYGLSAPEGSLIKSISVRGNEQALKACYVHNPLDSPLDWKVSATILPCYVTVWFASFERFMQFLKSGNAISPDVASETATVLQSKLDQVRRRAQEQLKMALEEESRFSINLDLDAPKVRIPANPWLDEEFRTQLVLDLGHFTLHTDNEERGNRLGGGEQISGSLYSQCYIAGNDIAAYLVDGPFEWEDMQEFLLKDHGNSPKHVTTNPLAIIPVIDRCCMFMLFEKLRLPHPAYPLTHIALQVPQLGLHFSPGRYRSLLQLLESFDASNGSDEKTDLSNMTQTKTSWYPADCEGSIMVLVWKGIGNSVAEWQPCWSVLSGSHLYILESVNTQTYQRCCSMNGKQILDVPSSSIGGSDYVLAVCNRGMELKKGLESSSSVILKLADQESKEMWQKALTSAVFRLSTPVSMLLPEDLDGVDDIDVRPSDYLDQPVLFVSGALHKLQLSIYATVDENLGTMKSESLLLSLEAGGGEVSFLQRQYDLTVGTNLHYLKIKDRLKDPAGTASQYLARSIINRSTSSAQSEIKVSEEDVFNDAMAEFGGSSTTLPESLMSVTHDERGERQEEAGSSSRRDFEALGLEHLKLAFGESLLNKLLSEKYEESRSFVSMVLVTRQFESPDYDGTDVKMSISMATLEFFCNRPSVVALIDFGTEISAIGDQQSESARAAVVSPESVEASTENTVVKGLLGQGKSRTVFHLTMGMDSVRIYLNLENGKQLAMLDQERFHMDLRVFPGSFGIHSTLGNLKIRDMTLAADHQWGWMCDIRDSGCDSLVKLDFQSFNVDEEDYRGYDYSLSGKILSVRIVFLYRFIQEVIAYFTALSAPHTQHFTRVVDKVAGIERLVPQSDIDGLPALKLNVSLKTPIIIVPGDSASKDFMQLDLGYLNVSNDFEWHGGSKDNDSAVHLDVLSAEISGINLVVGIGGVEGKSMVQDAQGLHLRVCRPLRDLFKKAPEVQVDVQVQMLKGILSDKEYLVISGCASSNIAEVPDLPPDFRNSATPTSDDAMNTSEIAGFYRTESDEDKNLRQSKTWTTVRVNVEVQCAELELYNGLEREFPLGRIELQGLWLNYRSTSLQETTLLLTLPRLCILDLRPATKPEMQLMLGSMADTEGNILSSVSASQETVMGPRPPMLVMDAKLKQDSQAFIIRIQRPRLLVVLDFLLSVGEFFVPSLAAVTSKEENMDSCNDPLTGQEHLRLATACFKQEAELMTISSNRRLIVDFPEIDVFTYDGCGNTLVLDIKKNGVSLSSVGEPIIVIGAGKKLVFKNITIKNGLRLKDCVQLHSHSSYSVFRDDGVFLDEATTNYDADVPSQDSDVQSGTTIKPASSSTNTPLSVEPMNFILELQAVAPELTFYDSERESYASSQRQEKLLRMKFDLNVMYAYRGSDVWLRAYIKRFSLEGGSGLTVIEPMVVSVEYACVKEKTSLNVFASDFSIQLSFSVMRLLLRLHNSLASTFRYGVDHILLKCSHFDRIWVNTEYTNGQRIAIWRPRAPAGFAILGDSITSGEAPPSQAVMAIRNIHHRAKRPLGFDLVYVIHDFKSSTLSDTSTKKDLDKGCSIWKPMAPPGYVALGCIAAIGPMPPPLTSVYCIRSDLVTSASINDCVLYASSHSGIEKDFSIWRIENVAGSFLAHLSLKPPARSEIYDVRDVAFDGENDDRVGVESSEPGNKVKGGAPKQHEQRPSLSGVENFEATAKAGRMIATTAQFDRMWWDKGSENRRIISIWRPVPPPGYVFVGDHITEGLEPPGFGIILKDDNSGRLAEPVRLVQCMHAPGKGQEQIYVWYPVAPAGFVTLGCVVSRDKEAPLLQALRCVRADLVNEVNMSKRPIWSNSTTRSGYNCSIWKLYNQANTFLARPDLKKPSDRLAYGLLATVQSRPEDNVCADIKLARFSVTVLDDFRGLMTPLANVSITSINLAANGRSETLSGVCVASMAASTFNAQLESWEPLIEPFEGIFKYESHDSQSGETLKAGKRIRITSTSIVNVNVTSANVDVLVDSLTSWKRQCEIEQKISSKMEQETDGESETTPAVSSALEEDNTEKVVLENKLGCCVFLRTLNHEFKDCKVLDAGSKVEIRVPPINYGDKFSSEKLKLSYQHIAVLISQATGLLVNEDGNGQEYFYSLHIAPINKQPIQGQKIPSQSARSRCVRPTSVSQTGSGMAATVAWNEVFVFDLPQKGTANLDVRVSNQAANSGRGELIGTVSVPIRVESDKETEAASSHWKLVQQSLLGAQTSWPLAQGKTFSLQLPTMQTHQTRDETLISECGSLVVSIYYFSEKLSRHAETAVEGMNHPEESALLLGLSSSGPWSSIRSLLALGPVPIHVPSGYMALEVAMQDGKKMATLRSLVTLSNDTDSALEVCACPISLLNSPDDALLRRSNEPVVEVEEIFENQRYQPLAGWGSKWPGHFLPTDPGRWSSRDNKRTSKAREDLEADLSQGWVWSTDWVIDKAGYVDDDGWAYGPDFQTLRWPPNSMKSCKKSPFDFIRRRRWCRVREQISNSDQVISRQVISVIQPGGSVSIPLSYILPTTEFCLQVRPQLGSTLTDYLWGRGVKTGSQVNLDNSKSEGQSSSRRASRPERGSSPISVFVLNQLQKAEELLMCPPANPSASRTAWWLCMESDANIIYNEVNSPVYDWKLSVSAPLKLENLLPCDAEYTVWERFREGNPIQRDRGVARAGSTINVFSVDIRKQIYLTWFVQGGWRSEKGIVLLSDPMGEELPSGFALVNQQSGRRLHLSLERDFGTSNAASRTVRIFVPYWVSNRAALPLSYCLVEIEPAKGSDGDSPWLMRAVKAAKHASSRPSHLEQVKVPRTQKVIQCLEMLENNAGIPTMLSIQAQLIKTGFLPFSPRTSGAGLISPRLGISACASHSNNFKDGISFKDLEDNERIIIKAMDESGAYYKLSVFLTMSSERTKVVNFQPHTLFVNRLGQQLYLRQGDLDCAELLYPNDPPKVILWQSASCSELIKVFIDGYEWSTPFSVDSEGISHVILKRKNSEDKMLIKAEIRNGTTESRYLVIFRHVSFISPYRIENHSLVFPICVRQAGGSHESWQSLPPGSAVPFAWEDLQRVHKLEIIVDGTDLSNSRTYHIDQCTSYLPITTEGTPVAAFYVNTVREDSTQVVKVGDWMPSNKELPIIPYGSTKRSGSQDQSLLHETQPSCHQEIEDQMHVVLELAELGVSIVDHTPEEILYLSLQNFTLAYSTGLGSGISRLKLRIDGLQLDNELPLTPMPVLFRNQGSVDPLNFVFKCTVTLQDGQSSNRYVYPYIGVQVPSAVSNTFLVNLHEPIIWRVQQMLQHLKLNRLTSSQTTDVSVDPIVSIGLLNTSEIRFKVSLVMSPSQRPRSALGFWASLMTALGNTDDLQIRIAPRVHEEICMRQSALVAACVSSIRKDILSHPLLLLSGVDILGNASSALGHMSKGVAALSMDKKFIKSRQKQDTKASVEGFGDGFREGAEALGKGLFRGVTGILTKPLEGARSSGVEGFVQGVGKGILGVAAQPVSGVLDLLSKTTEGANAVKTKIAAVITSEGVLMRRRLPRVIGADKILRPYDEFKAQGQILLQLAEGSSMFGPMDIFKVRGKFAMTDAYEDHYNLPKGRTLIITHCRVILLQHPTSIIVQKKPDLMKDPCSVLWDVTWSNLGAVELSHGKHNMQNGRPSRLILHLRNGAVEAHRMDLKELVRVIKCDPETDQASLIYSAIQQALSLYGPEKPSPRDWRVQRNVKRPYAGQVLDPTSFEGPGTSSTVPAIATLSVLLENPV